MKIRVLFLMSVILIVFFTVFYVNISYATDSEESKISDVITGADNFISKGKESGDVDAVKLKSASDMIYKILLVLGISIAVIIAAILGIKFMIGSVEEKAQVKDQLVPFLVGCIVIFGAFSIWKVAVSVGNNMDKTSTSTPAVTTTSCPHCGATVNFQMISQGKCQSCGGNL